MPDSVLPIFVPSLLVSSGQVHAVELHAAHPPGQVDAGRDVAPLVAAADLQFAAVLLVEMHEIVGLQAACS